VSAQRCALQLPTVMQCAVDADAALTHRAQVHSAPWQGSSAVLETLHNLAQAVCPAAILHCDFTHLVLSCWSAWFAQAGTRRRQMRQRPR
jgi:hypothetical protein